MACGGGSNAFVGDFRFPPNGASEGPFPPGSSWRVPRVAVVDLVTGRSVLDSRYGREDIGFCPPPHQKWRRRYAKSQPFEEVSRFRLIAPFFDAFASNREVRLSDGDPSGLLVLKVNNSARGGKLGSPFQR